MNPEKLLAAILSGRSDANVAFNELRGLLQGLGYQVRNIILKYRLGGADE
jgi:hypothetical protein